ncbi:MAG: tripartite tricarboxylate transporter substrate binding protein [Nitrospinota bacterium]
MMSGKKSRRETHEIFPSLTRRSFLKGIALGGAASLSPFALPASISEGSPAWPERPITTVIMYAAGGGTDTVIRTLVGPMAEKLGATINAINKPGAVGGIATDYVWKKPADGYWWLGAANYNKFVRVMGHHKSITWRDWQYYQAANSLASWSVRPDSPFKTLDDLIAAAKKNPGKISISTSGVGGLWHEIMAIVADAAGIELKFIPYKGGKPATLAGLQGEVDVAGGGVHEHVEFLRAGKLRNLAQTSAKDLEVPGYGTMKSVGNFIPKIKPLLPLGGIYNIALKRETPVEILEKIKDAWVFAANSEQFAKVRKRKFFELDIRTGAEADRRAAQVECVTGWTFWKLRKHIGRKVVDPRELGLPRPEEFESWWPPKGYKPRLA